MPRPLPSPDWRAAQVAARQHALITRAQAAAAGLSPAAIWRRARSGRWEVVAPDVYRVAGAPRTWEGRALAAVLSACDGDGTGAVLSHRAAAHLWGLDGFAAPGRVDVTVPRPRHPDRRPGLAVHRTRAWHLVDRRVRRLIPVTGPARTLVDLCAVVDDAGALAALDEIRRRRLATWAELWEALVRHAVRGRPGIARCRRVLQRRWGRRVPDTTFARLFMALLDEAGLPEPVAEHVVALGPGTVRVDLAYPALRIAVELDGKETHHTDRAFEDDRVRDNRLRLAGWTVLRYTWQRFTTEPAAIVAELRAARALPEPGRHDRARRETADPVRVSGVRASAAAT
ncbi:MAG TPA: type IV toxin-antitoxin system AbiEi family antitoxin domain-containing protein [Acidimicrobiales bacterium]|nr:type IV toxin-antitoxin system AbiEi family antitoxin domain-containing protein [Acidimicrobiales bacterium]